VIQDEGQLQTHIEIQAQNIERKTKKIKTLQSKNEIHA